MIEFLDSISAPATINYAAGGSAVLQLNLSTGWGEVGEEEEDRLIIEKQVN